jgi:thermitase
MMTSLARTALALFACLFTATIVPAQNDSLTYLSQGKEVVLKKMAQFRGIQVIGGEKVVRDILEKAGVKSESVTTIGVQEGDSIHFVIVDMNDAGRLKKGYDRRMKRAINRLDVTDSLNAELFEVVKTKSGTMAILVNEFMISFKPHVSDQDITDFFMREDITILRPDEFTKKTYVVKYNSLKPEQAIERSKQYDYSRIVFFAPNFMEVMGRSLPASVATTYDDLPDFQFFHAPSDPEILKQWYLSRIGVLGQTEIDSTCWDFSKGDNVVVAILDIGVDTTHVELEGKFVGGYNAVSSTRDQQPEVYSFHGTACAGIVAANYDNDIGIAGLAHNARIMPIRIATEGFDAWGFKPEYARKGILYAVNNGAKVLNCSWGATAENEMITNAIDTAIAANCILVFAAGNDGDNNVDFPASLARERNIIAVSAVNQWDEFKTHLSRDGECWGSDFGPAITVCAPGVQIRTLSNVVDDVQGYTYFNGTSSATPIVAASIALALAINPLLGPAEIKSMLQETAVKMTEEAFDERFGYGRLNVRQLLIKARASKPNPTVAPVPNEF